ncbi:MAG TPA: ornithine cyclodeaminase family protein, partial [Chloroflexota bacterium]|nr:ornithine cyclodeaminase family protein [Chloroflexota bacterium]
MLFIDNAMVQSVLTMDECIEVQERAFLGLRTGASIHRPRVDMYVPCERDDGYWRWGTMEGASSDLGVFAIRMKSDVITWPRHPDGTWTEEKYCVEPGTYCGLIFLLSTRNGEPLAMINDGHLQHMRVGGGAGLGVKYLSRPDAHVVGMIGSGGMARTYLRAFTCVREIHR